MAQHRPCPHGVEESRGYCAPCATSEESIRETIRHMRVRFENGQGTPQMAMCRLSLDQAEALLDLLDKERAIK